MSKTFFKKYKLLQKIGEGSFSEVLKCQDRQTGMLYAAKRLKKTYLNVSEILESPEVIAMRKIRRHPNILYMIESHYDALPGKVTLIFELMDMSLYDLMKARKGRIIAEQKVKTYLYQLLKGLEHLHRHGIFHRDIKPENILLKGDVLKLADLGSIRGIYSRPPYTEYISTRWYRSPECLLTTGFYGPKMDVWATGCVFYELLTLKPLFPGSSEVDQITKIHTVLGTPHARLVAKFRRHKSKNCEYFFPTKEGTGFGILLPQVTDDGSDILKSMLVYDPENRSNVKKLLEHRYFIDLRENESPKYSGTLTPCNSSHNPYQWRNPVLLSYITSERRRKLKPPTSCRSNVSHEALKIPRIVVSNPNAGPNLSNNSSITKVSKSDKSNVNAVKDAKKKLVRAWGAADICPMRRRRTGSTDSHEKMTKNSQDSESEVSDVLDAKLPRIKRSMKDVISYENNNNALKTKPIPTKRGPSTLATLHDFSDGKTLDQSYEPKCYVECPSTDVSEGKYKESFLPFIQSTQNLEGYLRPNITIFKSVIGQNHQPNSLPYANRLQKTSKTLATIKEQPIPEFAAHKITSYAKSPVTKSPAKKMAKHESTSLNSTSGATSAKKFSINAKKYYERRDKYGAK